MEIFKEPFLKKILKEIGDQPSRYILIDIERRKGEKVLKEVVDAWWGKTNETLFDYWCGAFDLSDEKINEMKKQYERAMGDPTLIPKRDPETLLDFHVVTESKTIHPKRESDSWIEKELDEMFLEKIIEESTIINQGQIENQQEKLPLLEEDGGVIDIETSLDSGTLLETGSTPKSKVKKEEPLDIYNSDDREELILDGNGNGGTLLETSGAVKDGETCLETKAVSKEGGTLLETKAVEKPEDRTVTLFGTPERSSLNIIDSKGTMIKSSVEGEEDEGYDPNPVFDAVGSICDDRYSNPRFLAQGGMGAVYVIHDDDLGKDVIKKVMLPQAKEHVGRFKREAQITTQLEHPNIPPVQEIAKQENGEVYYMQKYVKGHDLEKIIEKIGAKDPEFLDYDENKLLDNFLKVCEALEYAHFKGVIHRDLKPANIMVGEHGETYLMDWGLAKVLGQEDDIETSNIEIEEEVPEEKDQESFISSLSKRFFRISGEKKTQRRTRDKTQVKVTKRYAKTMTGAAGTPGYMPPEQIDDAKSVDARADVFAMGAILYNILTFENAFEGETPYNRIANTFSKNPIPVTKRWAWQSKPNKILESIVNKALAKELDDRYQSIKEMVDDIRAYKNNQIVKAHNYGLWEKTKTWNKRKHNVPLAVLSVAILASMFGGPAIALLERKARHETEGRLDAEKGKLLEAELRVRRSESDSLVSRGLEAEGKNNFEEAKRLYIQATTTDPSYAKAWNNLGYLFFDVFEDFEKAKISFVTAVIKDEEDKSYSLDGLAEKNLGDILFTEGRTKKKKEENYESLWEKAEIWYGRALKIKDHSESFNRRGILYYNWGKWDEAIADFSEKVKRTPNTGMGYGLRGLCYFRKNEALVAAGGQVDYDLLEHAVQDFEDAKEREYEKMNPLLKKAKSILAERQDK